VDENVNKFGNIKNNRSVLEKRRYRTGDKNMEKSI